MILPDVNLLVYAYNADAPKHDAARSWWDERLAGPEGVALAWVTLLGFIRICTHPKIHQNPMTPEEACGRIAEWLELPHFKILHPADGHFSRLQAGLIQLGTAANLTTDAHLAVLAMERGLVLHSTDADFSRFTGLKWVNPLR